MVVPRFDLRVLVHTRRADRMPGGWVASQLLILPALNADALAARHGMSLVLQSRGHSRFLQMVAHVRGRNLQSVGDFQLCRAGIPHLAYFLA